ncbi:MAG TPA: helix-turn-helix domain-containing protein [Candidatus Wunengus sp. YC60]
MDVRYYQRLESNKPGAVKIDTIGRIAKALNLTPSKLLDFK